MELDYIVNGLRTALSKMTFIARGFEYRCGFNFGGFAIAVHLFRSELSFLECKVTDRCVSCFHLAAFR